MIQLCPIKAYKTFPRRNGCQTDTSSHSCQQTTTKVITTICERKVTTMFVVKTAETLKEKEEWENAEQRMLKQISRSRAKSVAIQSKENQITVSKFKKALHALSALFYMQRLTVVQGDESCRDVKFRPQVTQYRYTPKSKTRHLLKVAKQDPVAWIAQDQREVQTARVVITHYK